MISNTYGAHPHRCAIMNPPLHPSVAQSPWITRVLTGLEQVSPQCRRERRHKQQCGRRNVACKSFVPNAWIAGMSGMSGMSGTSGTSGCLMQSALYHAQPVQRGVRAGELVEPSLKGSGCCGWCCALPYNTEVTVVSYGNHKSGCVSSLSIPAR